MNVIGAGLFKKLGKPDAFPACGPLFRPPFSSVDPDADREILPASLSNLAKDFEPEPGPVF